MTDIGPSMSGRISSPTYKGNTPSDFAITKVTLKGEAYSGDCFTIDPNDGFISINSTKDMQVGLYKLSISCISGGNYYEFSRIGSFCIITRCINYTHYNYHQTHYKP